MDVTLWDQFIKCLVKLLTSSDLVSLFMAIINILCGTDKMQNIMMYISSENGAKNLIIVTQTHGV